MPRLTAANTPAIANVNRMMNKKIAKRFRELCNTGGLEAALEYVGIFFRPEDRSRTLAALVAGTYGPFTNDPPQPNNERFESLVERVKVTQALEEIGGQ